MNKPVAAINLGSVRLELSSYASQGTGILGIRDSGKTYTAMLMAEHLMSAGVPIIAFDPIGVWRYLRVPGKGAGFPVVVAGGQDGDLPLTVASAPEITRAAMANGISLVIDLFDINLSKADWKRIVTSCLRVLLHENGRHGLRHVFIEEAAEFAPQRVGPDQGQVYAEMEKLARMGGNSRLGYTLINQRAEEVNKAVLELCDNLFLHRQKGKNSLASLTKWLDVGNVASGKEIIASLSTLPTGQCWVWAEGQADAVLVKVPEKQSLHPDRRTMRGEVATAKKAVDVGRFVETMKGSLEAIAKEDEANDPAKLRKRIKDLERELGAKVPAGHSDAELEAEYRRGLSEGAATKAQALGQAVLSFAADFALLVGEDAPPAPSRPRPAVPAPAKPVARQREAVAPSDGSLTGPQTKIVRALSMWRALGHEEPTKIMVAAVAGYSPNSGGYANLLGQLRAAGVVDYPRAGHLRLTGSGIDMSATEGRDLLLGTMSNPQRKLFDALLGGELSKADLASATGYSASSGGYANLLGQLRSMGLADYPSAGRVALAPWVFEVMA